MQKHKITVSDVFTLGKAARATIGWVKRESWKCSVLILMLVVGTVFYGSANVDIDIQKSGNFTCKVITELDSASHSQVCRSSIN